MTTPLIEKASQTRILITDVDGVMTDGGLLFDPQGKEYKRFNSLDGHGIRMLLDNGIEAAVITGRESPVVSQRMRELGVNHVYQGQQIKLQALNELLANIGLDAAQACYIGDDLPDLPVMRRVGLSVAVPNAHDFVKQHCDWVTTSRGGHGAVREVTDFILDAQGKLKAQQIRYLE